MQPNPYYYPNYSHAQWLYAHVPQMPYLPHPWIPQGPAYHHPDVPGHAPQLPGYNPTHSKADRDARKLQQAIQDLFPSLPAAAAIAVEMHLSMSVRFEDKEKLNVVPLDDLFAAAGTGWGMRLEILHADRVLALPLAQACTDSLKQFQKVYLMGQEVPPLYITYYWTDRPNPQHVSILSGPLESALQEIVSNPVLALPKAGGVAAGLLAHGSHMTHPVGQVQFLEVEVEQWIEAAGLEKLHAKSHKDFSSLVQDPLGVTVGPDVSFGLKQLVSHQPQHGVESQHYAHSSEYGHSLQQDGRHQQPFIELLGSTQDSQLPTEQDQLYYFRQIVVRNNEAEHVQLIDVRFSQKLPLWPHTIALVDDAGISTVIKAGRKADTDASLASHETQADADKAHSSSHHQQRQKQKVRKKKKQSEQQQQQQQDSDKQSQQHQQSEEQSETPPHLSMPESAAHEEKQKEGMRGVVLRPGEEYCVTVVLNCLDGPHRRLESGVLPQLVLFTFLVHKSNTVGSEGQRQASMINSVGSRSSTPPLPPPAPSSAKPVEMITLKSGVSAEVVVVARQVSVCLVSKSEAADQQKMLNVEAKPFIPDNLKHLFDQPPTSFMSCRRPLDILFSHQLTDTEAQSQPAYKQDAVSLLPQGWPQKPVGEQVRKWVRLLRLEETALHQDVKRFDMFNVKLHKVKFDPVKGRSYSLFTLSDEPVDKQRLPYRGPNLRALYGRSWQQLIKDDMGKIPFFTLQVPGLVEKRPNLIIGDLVYIRFAANPSKEWSGWVVVTHDVQCMLAIPNLEPQKDQGSRGLVHVRFTFDRTPFRRMLRALLAVASQKRTMQLLPPHQATPRPPLSGKAESSPEAAQASAGITAVLPSDDLFKAALVSTDKTSLPGAKPDQLPSLRKMQRKAGFLEEVGAQKLNSQQREAVASVLVGAGGGCHPLTLFGPPGTGKTVTLVECALQVYSTVKGARLLMCAPQNFSADLLFRALSAAGIPKDYMIRLNDPRVPPTQVQEDVRPHCFYNEDTNYFGLPTAEQLAGFNIVVCTCGAAGMLREGKYAAHYEKACRDAEKEESASLRPLEFTHVMIDEAGQALGPEALIPLTLLAPQGSCAMLCGDPRQLGPVLHSTAAEGHGLKTSLLEAFVHFHTGQQQHYADLGLAPCLGMLVHNYRSHSRLLELPSRLYYNNQLLASADPQLVTAPMWDELQKHDRGDEGQWHEPKEQDDADSQGQAEVGNDSGSQLAVNTLFYGVRGQQMRDGDAPSYYNPVEASTLVKLLQGLLAYKTGAGQGVTVQDIGVIATYRNQVKKLRLLLRARELAAVRVGTVDDFQGQEARIIFISTVLSRPADLPMGGKAPKGSGLNPRGVAADPTVGFFSNPNRFNVAITRAQALMVVLGHPLVLMQDPNWSELVKYCAARGAYRGAGSESLGALVRNQPSEDSYLPGEDSGEVLEEDSLEIQQAVSHIAEVALLGVGDANRMFPESLEEMYDSYGGEEMEFRVIL